MLYKEKQPSMWIETQSNITIEKNHDKKQSGGCCGIVRVFRAAGKAMNSIFHPHKTRRKKAEQARSQALGRAMAQQKQFEKERKQSLTNNSVDARTAPVSSEFITFKSVF